VCIYESETGNAGEVTFGQVVNPETQTLGTEVGKVGGFLYFTFPEGALVRGVFAVTAP
jgi:hypothetical protein